MLTGVVRAREARIRLRVRGPFGQEREIEAVVDTGFTGLLTLPPELVTDLGLSWHSVGEAVLADGSKSSFDVYQAKVLWDGKARRVVVSELDCVPLVGMGLLRGYNLNVQVRPRGKVTIRRLL